MTKFRENCLSYMIGASLILSSVALLIAYTTRLDVVKFQTQESHDVTACDMLRHLRVDADYIFELPEECQNDTTFLREFLEL